MRYCTALLALFLLACDGSGPSELAVTASATRTFGVPLPPLFRVEATQLIIAGTIDLNEPCYEFAASLGEAADTLVVRLRATRQNRPCHQELARFNYTLTITGLKPGVQPLRLVYDRVGPPTFVEVAFEGAVDIT
jgi:hypothetical protein